MKKAWRSGIIGSILGLVVLLGAGQAGDQARSIHPGEGITDIRIGQQSPANRTCNRPYPDWEVSCDAKGRVTTIIVKIPEYAVVRNGLRVGSPLEEVFRFYGYGKKESIRDGILIKYPEQGIDFQIAIGSERVTWIIIYNPLPKFPAQKYEPYQEQLKKKY